MPPPKKKKFQGQGRVLSTGDIVEGKKVGEKLKDEVEGEIDEEVNGEMDMKMQTDLEMVMSREEAEDGEYRPGVLHDDDDDFIQEDSDSCSDQLGSDSEADDLDSDEEYVQVKELGGKYTKVKVSKAQIPEQATVEKKVVDDKRFARNSKRGLARFAVVIKRAEVEKRAKKDLDCNVKNNGRVKSVTTSIEQCKHGIYRAVRHPQSGVIQYKAMTKQQIEKARADDDGTPCRCPQCELMAKNNNLMKPVGSSRLRSRPDTFEPKFGVGKTLGGGSS